MEFILEARISELVAALEEIRAINLACGPGIDEQALTDDLPDDPKIEDSWAWDAGRIEWIIRKTLDEE